MAIEERIRGDAGGTGKVVDISLDAAVDHFWGFGHASFSYANAAMHHNPGQPVQG